MIIEQDYGLILRERRKKECFPIVNRGFLWYNRLTREQLNELDEWYQAWLDAPKTRVVPPLPQWVNSKLEKETEEILL
jgi:hypothetical protein